MPCLAHNEQCGERRGLLVLRPRRTDSLSETGDALLHARCSVPERHDPTLA